MILPIVLLALFLAVGFTIAGMLFMAVSGRNWPHLRWCMPVWSLVFGIAIYGFASGFQKVAFWHVAVTSTLAVLLALNLKYAPRAAGEASPDAVLGFAVLKSTFILTVMALATAHALTREFHHV